jgi:hypothetical protein
MGFFMVVVLMVVQHCNKMRRVVTFCDASCCLDLLPCPIRNISGAKLQTKYRRPEAGIIVVSRCFALDAPVLPSRCIWRFQAFATRQAARSRVRRLSWRWRNGIQFINLKSKCGVIY